MSETATFPRCRSTEAVSCGSKSGGIGDRQNTEYRPHRRKVKVEGVERNRGDRKKRVASRTSCSTSCSDCTLVSLSL
jgi:hypothetical protein